jgi:hypothetical protein
VRDVLLDKEAQVCDNARYFVPRSLSGVVSDLVVVSRRGRMAAVAGIELMIGSCALKTRICEGRAFLDVGGPVSFVNRFATIQDGTVEGSERMKAKAV